MQHGNNISNSGATQESTGEPDYYLDFDDDAQADPIVDVIFDGLSMLLHRRFGLTLDDADLLLADKKKQAYGLFVEALAS